MTLPDGSPYTYCVGKEKSAIKYDILAEFSRVMQANNLGHGIPAKKKEERKKKERRNKERREWKNKDKKRELINIQGTAHSY